MRYETVAPGARLQRSCSAPTTEPGPIPRGRSDAPGQPPAGFLMPTQWKAALEAVGFADVRFLPDVPSWGDRFPRFHVAVMGATRP